MAFSPGDLILLRGNGAGVVPRFSSFFDDFSGTLPSIRWNREYGSPQTNVVAGEAQLATNTGYAQMSSNDVYSLVGSQLSFKLTRSGLGTSSNGSASGVENYAFLKLDANNYLLIYQGNDGFVKFQVTTAGVSKQYQIFTSQTGYNYWRFRENAGTVYFDASTDGVNWLVGYTTATPAWLTTTAGLRIVFQTGVYGTGLSGVSPAYMAVGTLTGGVADTTVRGIIQLVDDFSGVSVDPSKWSIYTGATNVTQSSGNLVMSPTAGTDAYIESNGLYSLTNQNAVIKVASMDAGISRFTFEAGPASDIHSTGNNVLFQQESSGQLYFSIFTNGARTNISQLTATPGVTYNYLRIRNVAGVIFFDTSLDGQTWTQRETVTPSFSMENSRITAYAQGTSGAVRFDALNITAVDDAITIADAVTKAYALAVDDSVTATDIVTPGALFSAPIVAAAGGGNWSSTTTWVGGVVPTAANDVQLTSTSGNVTIDAAAVCRSLDCTGYTGTLTHAAAVTLSIGDATAGANNSAIKLVSGMTYTLGSGSTSTLAFVSTSPTQQTLDFGGKTVPAVTFNGVGSSYILASNYTTTSGNLTFTNATFSTGNFNMNTSAFVTSGTGTVVFNFGSSTITLTSGNFNLNSNGAGVTLNAGTSSIVTNGGVNTGTSSFTFYNLTMTGASTSTLQGSHTFNNLTFLAPASKTGQITLSGNHTVNGTLAFTGNSITNRIFVKSSVPGTARTLNAATVTALHADFQDITAAGAANWNLSAITGGSGDAGGNTGITFTAAQTNYAVGITGTTASWSSLARWASSSGGATSSGRVPLPQDNAVIDGNSGAGTNFNIDMPRACKDLTWNAAAMSCTFAATVSFFGNVIFTSVPSIVGTGFSTTFEGRGAHTLSTNNVSWSSNGIIVYSVGGSYTLGSSFTTTSSFTVQPGTFNTNNYNLTALSFGYNNIAGTKVIDLGTSTLTLTATTGTVYSGTNTTTTLSASNASVVISTTSASGRTFSPGTNQSFGSLTYTVAGSTGSLTIASNCDIGTLNFSDATNARTLTISSTRTVTITSAFNVFGSAGKLMSITGTTSADSFVYSGAGVVSSDYLLLTNIKVSPTSNTWYAGNNSVDNGGNTGWTFSAPPVFLNVNDSVTLSDVLALAASISFSDSTTSTDSAATVWSAQYAVNDTATLAETLAKAAAVTLNDTVTLTDAAPVTFSLTKADTVTATDLVATAVAISVGDSITATEVAARLALFDRAVSDSVVSTDTLSSILNFNSSVSDSVVSTDNFSTVSTYSRTLTDSVTPTDNITTAVDFVLTVSDSVVSLDTITPIWNGARSYTDATTTTDALQTDLTFVVSQSVVLIDTSAAASATSFADSVVATESASTLATYSRNFSDAFVATDLITSSISLTVNDSVTSTDATTQLGTFVRTVDESLTVADNESANDEITVSETIAVVDVITGLTTYLRAVNDAVTLTDSLTSSVAISVNNSVVMTETSSSVWTANLNVTDSTASTDNTTSAVSKSVNDTTLIDDDPVVEAVGQTNINDNAAVTDASSSVMSFASTFNDAYAPIDALSKAVVTTAADAVTLTDNIDLNFIIGSVDLTLSVNDSTVFTDQIVIEDLVNISNTVLAVDALSKSLAITINDALAITDNAVPGISRPISINDAVSTSDGTLKGINPAISDLVTVIEYIASKNVTQDINFLLDIADEVSTNPFIKSDDSVTVDDLLELSQDFAIQIDDTISLNEERVYEFELVLDNGISVGDILEFSSEISIDDPLDISDLLADVQLVGMDISKFVIDTVTIDDSIDPLSESYLTFDEDPTAVSDMMVLIGRFDGVGSVPTSQIHNVTTHSPTSPSVTVGPPAQTSSSKRRRSAISTTQRRGHDK